MTAKSTLLIPFAALCMTAAEFAVPAACQQGSLDGTRVLTNNCGDGGCGVYQVGSGSTDLGFGGTLPDTIYFEFWPITPPPATGTFDLGSGNNNNYSTCEQCILVHEDLFAGVPQKTFFQTGGSITIDPNTVPGTAVAIGLSWSSVTLAEVTVNPDTNVSTLVQNGACYTIASADQIFHNGFEAP